MSGRVPWILTIVLAALVAAVAMPSDAAVDVVVDEPDRVVLRLDPVPIVIETDPDGHVSVRAPGYGQVREPGRPVLPRLTTLIALPAATTPELVLEDRGWMVASTRLDCMIQSSALMRQALAQATHHAAYREAFGKKLVDQPLMQNVLADLTVESEAALPLTLRVARAVEEGEDDPHAAGFARVATAVGKYWICKRAPMHVNEALECLGGAGYVEESILPRLYREAPLLSIWEGCGNIQCLDVLRATVREPEGLASFVAEVKAARGLDARADAAIQRMDEALADPDDAERRARITVERMAVALQASLLLRGGNEAVADAFCARLEDGASRMLGTLPARIDARALAERARPRLGQKADPEPPTRR